MLRIAAASRRWSSLRRFTSLETARMVESVTSSMPRDDHLATAVLPSKHQRVHQNEFTFRGFSTTTRFGNDGDNSDEMEEHEDKDEDYEDDVDYENEDDYGDFDDEDDYDSDDNDRGYKKSKRGKKQPQKTFKVDTHEDRLYLDPNWPLSNRIDRFLARELGTMHPLDIILSSVDLIKECGKHKEFDEYIDRGEKILYRILEEKSFVNNGIKNNEPGFEGRHYIFVPESVFQMLIYSWSNKARRIDYAAQKMREVLKLMLSQVKIDAKFHREEPNEEDPFSQISGKPTVAVYLTLLQGLMEAAYRSFTAAIEAEHVLDQMVKMNLENGWHTKPNSRCFSIVINSFSRAGHPTSGKRADAILQKMINIHKSQKKAYEEKHGVEYNILEPSENKHQIVTPDAVCYTSVIQAHTGSKAPGSSTRSLELLKEMMQSENPKVRPDSYAFSAAINGFTKLAGRPSAAIARFEAAEKAEKVLWLMVDEMKRRKEAGDVGPEADQKGSLFGDAAPFNTAMNAWAQANVQESASRAEAILHKMLDPSINEITEVAPNTTSFNSCLHAMSRGAKSDPSLSERARGLLQLMKDLQSEDAIPDAHTYTSVMNAFAKSDNIRKTVICREIFLEMLDDENLIRSKKKIGAVPYTAILTSAAHSPSSHEAASSENGDNAEDGFGLEYAADDDLESAMAERSPSEDEYAIALQTYRELLGDVHDFGVKIDHVAFAAMLNVVARHTAPESIERRQRVESVFSEACDGGHVSMLVIEALQKACPSKEQLQELLGIKHVYTMKNTGELSHFWTINAPKQRKAHRSKKPREEGNERNSTRGGRNNKKN